MKNRIRALREARGLTQTDIATALSCTKQAVSAYESGSRNPDPDTLAKIADILGTDIDFLLCREKGKGARIPVLGRVAAGIPIEAIEEIVDYEDIPAAMAKGGEYFGLRIRGDSMTPRIVDGDTVIVRRQDTADDGDIVIAIVNGSDGCCKRLRMYNGSIALISLNPAYAPMIYTDAEVDSIPVRIIGKVVELRGKL